MSFAVEGLSIA